MDKQLEEFIAGNYVPPQNVRTCSLKELRQNYHKPIRNQASVSTSNILHKLASLLTSSNIANKNNISNGKTIIDCIAKKNGSTDENIINSNLTTFSSKFFFDKPPQQRIHQVSAIKDYVMKCCKNLKQSSPLSNVSGPTLCVILEDCMLSKPHSLYQCENNAIKNLSGKTSHHHKSSSMRLKSSNIYEQQNQRTDSNLPTTRWQSHSKQTGIVVDDAQQMLRRSGRKRKPVVRLGETGNTNDANAPCTVDSVCLKENAVEPSSIECNLPHHKIKNCNKLKKKTPDPYYAIQSMQVTKHIGASQTNKSTAKNSYCKLSKAAISPGIPAAGIRSRLPRAATECLIYNNCKHRANDKPSQLSTTRSNPRTRSDKKSHSPQNDISSDTKRLQKLKIKELLQDNHHAASDFETATINIQTNSKHDKIKNSKSSRNCKSTRSGSNKNTMNIVSGTAVSVGRSSPQHVHTEALKQISIKKICGEPEKGKSQCLLYCLILVF